MSLPSSCQRAGHRRAVRSSPGTRVRERGGVVDERVDPDVDRLARVPGQRYAPVDGLARDRDVLQTALDVRSHLVEARLGQHERRIRGIALEQRIGVGGEAEERVALLREDRDGAVLRAAAVDEVVLVVERLARRAVEAGVRALVEVAALAHALHEALHEGLVLGIGRADEEVVGRLDVVGELAEARRDRVGPLLGRDARGRRRLLDLLAVLIGARQEERVGSGAPGVPRRHVGRDRRVGMAEMRLAIDVVDRRRDVVGLTRARHQGSVGRGRSTAASYSARRGAPVRRATSSLARRAGSPSSTSSRTTSALLVPALRARRAARPRQHTGRPRRARSPRARRPAPALPCTTSSCSFVSSHARATGCSGARHAGWPASWRGSAETANMTLGSEAASAAARNRARSPEAKWHPARGKRSPGPPGRRRRVRSPPRRWARQDDHGTAFGECTRQRAGGPDRRSGACPSPTRARPPRRPERPRDQPLGHVRSSRRSSQAAS